MTHEGRELGGDVEFEQCNIQFGNVGEQRLRIPCPIDVVSIHEGDGAYDERMGVIERREHRGNSAVEPAIMRCVVIEMKVQDFYLAYARR